MIRLKEKPQKTSSDLAHSIVKTGLSAIALIGGSPIEIFSQIITSSLEKRRDEWIESIAKGLLELEKKIDGFSLLELSENDEFITSLIYASQIALRNHQEEKIRALQNAVLNEALLINIEQDKRFMFIRFIDELTSSHLILLFFLHDPKKWALDRNIKFPKWDEIAVSIGSAIEYSIDDFKGKCDFYDQLGRDLFLRGLLTSDSFHHIDAFETLLTNRTTDLGIKFIKYISNPNEK